MRRDRHSSEGNGLKQFVALLCLAFVFTFGVVIATRMSTDAIGVLVGVAAGVAASIPTALLLMAVTRRDKDDRDESYEDRRAAAPPVIVVAPGSAMPTQLPPYVSTPYETPRVAQSPRRFRVMGLEDEEEEAVDGDVSAVYWER